MAVLPSVDLSQAMLTVEQLLRRIAGFDSPLLTGGLVVLDVACGPQEDVASVFSILSLV